MVGAEGTFRHQTVRKKEPKLYRAIVSASKAALLLWWLWFLFFCGDWTLLEDQGTVTWSSTPTYSRCLDISYNALWPNSKICVLLPLKSRGRRGCKHHFSFFSLLKGHLLLWRGISAVSIFHPKDVKCFTYAQFLPYLRTISQWDYLAGRCKYSKKTSRKWDAGIEVKLQRHWVSAGWI